MRWRHLAGLKNLATGARVPNTVWMITWKLSIFVLVVLKVKPFNHGNYSLEGG